ncbi:MAG: UTP--glucose-1-phosphate uridylyltransferase [Chloroflexi bacterium RBG_13_53_26]|nr:MAG: UTP--glucose-1-phosphate uridylyltransferase [Chloroflexi bacterium RBG_13_53_26]
MARIRKAVITAAGWGTRFLPVTKSQPKEMLPLLNKPLIQYSVEEAAACGVDLVVIITSLGKRAMEDYFDRSFELEQMLERQGKTELLDEIRRLSSLADICYVRQKEQLGLGHAVLTAKNVVGDEPFILFLPDDIFEHGELVLKQMLAIHERHRSSVISVREVAEEEVSRYGIIKAKKVAERVYEVQDLVEKPKVGEAPSRLAIMGRYVLRPEIFAAIESTPPGRNGEIQITDALKRLGQKQPIYAYEFDGELYDAGTLLGWLKTTVALGLKDPVIGSELRDYLGDQLRD